jgi:hypothetical protein
MSERIFLSEYCGENKSSWVCRRRAEGDFVVVCYRRNEEQTDLEQVFATESAADDFAEDWVLQAE